MKRFASLIFLVPCLLFSISGLCQDRKVFAHYMLAIGTEKNNSVEGFKEDVKEAMKCGIDGFALNFGAWEPRYRENIKNMVEAIDEIDSDFVFFLSIDKSSDMPDSVGMMLIKRYYNNKKYYHYQGKFFLSAWGGRETAAQWESDVLLPLKREGYDIYFVPHFWLYPNTTENPSYDEYLDNIDRNWKGVIDGFFYFGVAALPSYSHEWPSLLSTGEAAAKACRKRDLTYMACVTPSYWQVKRPKNGRRYYDYGGGEGLTAQWHSILDIQKPEWVELVTWNDWDENTYFSPLPNIGRYSIHVTHPEDNFYKSHVGYDELNKYFIEWYKTGHEPAIEKDKIFYFYRTHPMDLVASNDAQGEVTKKVGDVKDVLHITTLLKEPADLVVTTGDKKHVLHIKQGLVNSEVPFESGKQIFELQRNGKTVVSGQGEDIVSAIDVYNFVWYSGFAE